MKRPLTVFGLAAALALTWSIGLLEGQGKQPKKKN
jgi:hypothetical protein